LRYVSCSTISSTTAKNIISADYFYSQLKFCFTRLIKIGSAETQAPGDDLNSIQLSQSLIHLMKWKIH
jgi:hypothetical protein